MNQHVNQLVGEVDSETLKKITAKMRNIDGKWIVDLSIDLFNVPDAINLSLDWQEVKRLIERVDKAIRSK